MAEVIGIAAGVLELTKFALKASSALSREIKEYRSRNDRVNDLLDELDAQSVALTSLQKLASQPSQFDISGIELPLRRCFTACNDFRDELSKCVARSGDDKISFRSWAKLRYMGEDIDGYRRRIAGYKYSIDVVLADVNLRATTVTIERLDAYTELVNDAQAVFEDRLGMIDDKIERLLQGSEGRRGGVGKDLEMIREERTSTEQCLMLCSQLSSHISEMQRSAGLSDVEGSSMESPPQILNESLRECKASLAQAAARLGGCESELFKRLIDKSMGTVVSQEDRADLVRLKEEREATRQSMEACTRLAEHIKEDASTIENYATGDAWQYMVSTGGKTIHGKNKGLGWRARQIGGHMSDESLQQITQTLSNANMEPLASIDREDTHDTSRRTNDVLEAEEITGFKGKGHRLEVQTERRPVATSR